MRRYHSELFLALLLYAGLLVAANLADDHFRPTGIVRMALVLVPMFGAFAAAWAILRGIRRMDELQRKIQFDAIAFSFLFTALGTFGWGFAEIAGAPDLPTFAIWPIMGTAWGVGAIVAHRRFR